VEESVGRMKDITLFNLEQIERFAGENISLRTGEIRKVEQIIEEEIDRFYEWQSYAYVR
jgi:glutamyl-tRNA reductase